MMTMKLRYKKEVFEQLIGTGDRIMLGAIQLGSFESDELADALGLNRSSVRTRLSIYRYMFNKEYGASERRGPGGVRARWILKETPEASLAWFLSEKEKGR